MPQQVGGLISGNVVSGGHFAVNVMGLAGRGIHGNNGMFHGIYRRMSWSG